MSWDQANRALLDPIGHFQDRMDAGCQVGLVK
jgi:hypothetical protein